MGIVNVTPDSFYDGGKNISIDNTLEQTSQHLTDGATFIDVGGYSSRPGATSVSEDEEIKRVIEIIQEIVNNFPNAIVSIDTFRSKVAALALDAGAQIINDISAANSDSEIVNIAVKNNCPYIAMHMQGTPQTMQNAPHYDNVTVDIIKFFDQKINEFQNMGIKDIIIDPGFGFGKDIDHNFTLLKELQDFKMLNTPVLIGLSRKSMICKPLECGPSEALNGTTVLNTIAIQNGANILRVHDVKEAMETIKLVKQTLNA